MTHDPTIHHDYANLQRQQQHQHDMDLHVESEPITPPPDKRKPNILIRMCQAFITIFLWVAFVNFLQAF